MPDQPIFDLRDVPTAELLELPKLDEEAVRLFWQKVDVRGSLECWEWKAGRTSSGYGCFWFEGKSYQAHRIAFELGNGPLPKGKWSLHKCDNDPCCNPAHLFPGTRQDNIRDMVVKGRQRGAVGSANSHCIVGEDGAKSLLAEYTSGNRNISRLARKYKISRRQVGRIVRGDQWKHL